MPRTSHVFSLLRRQRKSLTTALCFCVFIQQISQPLRGATYIWDGDLGTSGAQDVAGRLLGLKQTPSSGTA